MSEAARQQAIQRAVQLQQSGRLQEAEQICRQLVADRPDDAGALRLLGVLAGQRGSNEEAAQLFARCLEIDPNDAAAHTSLGSALAALGREGQAIEHFRRAVELQPDSPQMHYNLGKALRDQEQLEGAERSFRRAVELQPDFGHAWNNLGNTLRDLGRPQEAVPCYLRDLQMRPRSASTLHNLGLSYRALMKLDDAMRAFDAALAIKPEHHECRVSRAMLLILRGDFQHGWREYEARWKIQRAFKQRDYAQPLWDGSDPSGRTILLHFEQGFGDTIQFARYAPLLAARGARVIVECQPELKDLLQTLRGVERVVAKGEPIPPFEAYRAMMSLPMAFGTTVNTVPAEVPYLRADPRRLERWRQLIPQSGLRIGLAWAGAAGYQNDRNRSMALQQFAPLARRPNTRFVSLQKGAAAAQTASPPAGMDILDVGEQLKDFADTAAAIQCLDLVICVDTAIGHLAGAMGKPVWLLIPFSPDWRWMIDREDTPWYPTMKLFRQPKPGDWDTVISRIVKELELW